MDAIIGLGSNLGDRLLCLAGAVRALSAIGNVTSVSNLYETDPVGPPQPPYLNAALRLDWGQSARALLSSLLGIEQMFGRVRGVPLAPRTLDLDILFIFGLILDEPGLVVPHPRLLERRFSLAPLVDVAKDAVPPRSSLSFHDLLSRLPPGGVRLIAGPEWAKGKVREGLRI